MRRVLVTGGGGFVGSHVVDRLLADGNRVGVVDNLSTGSLAGLSEEADLEIADVCSPECADWITRWRPSLVIHLAAQAKVGRSVADPVHDARVNVLGTLAVLDAAVRAGADKLVLASSGGTVYGESQSGGPWLEDAPHRPVSPYGLTKATASRYAELYGRLYGLSTTILTLGNVYGAGRSRPGAGGVVAYFVAAVCADQRPVVFGDGNQTRDFVHVTDVADAFARAVSKGDGAILNVGTGVATSVNEVLSLVGAATRTTPQYRPALPGEVRHNVLDVSRAREVLGRQAGVGLPEGVARVVTEHLTGQDGTVRERRR